MAIRLGKTELPVIVRSVLGRCRRALANLRVDNRVMQRRGLTLPFPSLPAPVVARVRVARVRPRRPS